MMEERAGESLMSKKPLASRRRAALGIVETLRHAGHEAYWVGGCVRDALFGLEPREYDVATAARPEDVIALFESTREVGRSFAVIHVRSGGVWTEVSSFRSEGTYSDARHPDAVAPADVRTDAARRDFTINALYQDPLDGRILDFVGGRADIEKRILRCVGDPDRRLHEDALRLMRAVRFASRFDLTLEPATARALRRNASRIGKIAVERVRDELLRMLTGPAPHRALTLMHESSLLEHVAPEVERLRGCEQSPRHHPEGDVWVHTLRMLEIMAQREEPDEALALGVLLHDVGKPVTRAQRDGQWTFYGHEKRGRDIAAAFLERLAVPVAVQEQVLMLVGDHMQFLNVQRMRKSTLRRFVLQPEFERLLELHRLDALSSRGDLTQYDFCREAREQIEREGVPVRPLLDGHALMALGFLPGPRLGKILSALVDAQLEGEVRDAAGARRWVRENFDPASADGADTSARGS